MGSKNRGASFVKSVVCPVKIGEEVKNKRKVMLRVKIEK